MSLLQVSPYPVWPPNFGGAQRVHGLVSEVYPEWTVTRFALDLSRPRSVDQTIEIDDDYVEYRYSPSVAGILPDAVNIRRLWPSPMLHVVRHRQLRKYVRTADIIQVEHPGLFPYLHRIKPDETPIVYSSHNIESERVQAPELIRPVVRWRLSKLERYAVRSADIVITVSEEERDWYRNEYSSDSNYHVAYNGTNARIDSNLREINHDEIAHHNNSDKLSCIFVGSDYEPNNRAVNEIVSWSDHIDGDSIEFLIIGSVCSAIDETEIPSNVKLVGYVEDLSPWYAISDVGINPVHTGSGSNTKIPEFLAHGLPTVTTPFGASGFPVEDGYHLLERPLSEFPATLRAINKGTIDTDQLRQHALEIVEEKLHWSQISKNVLEMYKGLLSG